MYLDKPKSRHASSACSLCNTLNLCTAPGIQLPSQLMLYELCQIQDILTQSDKALDSPPCSYHSLVSTYTKDSLPSEFLAGYPLELSIRQEKKPLSQKIIKTFSKITCFISLKIKQIKILNFSYKHKDNSLSLSIGASQFKYLGNPFLVHRCM